MGHTKGDWKYKIAMMDSREPKSTFGFAIEVEGKIPYLCDQSVYSHHHNVVTDNTPYPLPDADKYFSIAEITANAKLIAASPDMLEALQSVWKDSINADINCQLSAETTMKVLKAISKAEGK